MWEDQGRQDHGWFGTGTSGTIPDPSPPRATTEDLGRLIAGAAVQHLPRHDRQDFEEFTGRDSGKTLLAAMQVWTDASHLDPAAFRTLVVGRGLTAEGAASLQAMARTLADPSDPAALAQAGPQLASALLTAGRGNVTYGLSYAQDKALYADANGLVPERLQMAQLAPAIGLGEKALEVAIPRLPSITRALRPLILLGEAVLPYLAGLGVGAAAGVTVLVWPSHLADDTIDGQRNKPGPGPGGPVPALPQRPDTDPSPPIAKPGEEGFTLTPPARVGPAPPAPPLPPVQPEPGPGTGVPQGPNIVESQGDPGLTRPTGPINGKPTGQPSVTRAGASPEGKAQVDSENQVPQVLAASGYGTVANPTEGANPALTPERMTAEGLNPEKRPDLLVENRVFDTYTPEADRVESIRSGIENKINDKQTHRVVVDLRNTSQTEASLRAALRAKPIPGLREVITLTKDGLGRPFRP